MRSRRHKVNIGLYGVTRGGQDALAGNGLLTRESCRFDEAEPFLDAAGARVIAIMIEDPFAPGYTEGGVVAAGEDGQRRKHLSGRAQNAELANGGSDRFIDAMVLWGDADKVKQGLRAHFDAGATHVAIQPVHPDGDVAARDAILTALADT